MSIGTHRRWSLTRSAFDRLLLRLNAEPERAAREYDVVRYKLIGYFARRGVGPSEALADETIDRVARRLDEGHIIEHLDAYFYGVANRVMLESRKRRAREQAATRQFPSPEPAASSELREVHVACLERCLRRLPRDSRALIVGYYRGRAEERQGLAETLGISYTNLRTRTRRLRIRIEECLRECLEARSPSGP
jgi:DNA-directed RNA polymerase specialized sigma24 family protein